jgi:peptide/nickel transport system substrate-binding protein
MRFIPVERQLEMLLDGRLDIVTELPGTATLRVSRHPETQVVKKATFYTVCATFNTSRGPLADVRVRRAINYAINKRDLVRYDLLGNGRIIASLSMPGEVGHDPSLEPYAYDPEKARQLLKETGLPLPLKLKTLIKVQGGRTAHILEQQLKAVGIDLDIYGVTTDADAIRDMASKDFDVGISGFPDVMGHVFFVQSIMIYSKSPFSVHRDPDYDRRLEAMVGELDPAAHERLARDLDRYVYDQSLSLFTYQQVRTYGVSRRVDFVPYVTGRLHLFDVSSRADAEGGDAEPH